jgi:predicted PurR-regulated permease PerM
MATRTALRIEIAPRTIVLALIAAGLVWAAFRLSTVLVVVTVALVLVGTLDPVVAWLERHGLKRGRALILIFVALSAVVAAVLLLTVPPLVMQLLDMLQHAPERRTSILHWLDSRKGGEPIAHALRAVPVEDLVTRAGDTLLGYSSRILMLVGYSISTLFLAIYLLADPVRSKGLLYALIPRAHHLKLARILRELKRIVGGYMRGQLITSVAIGMFVFVVLTAFGVKDALALALFAALTDIIPFVGGYVASTPAVISVSGSGAGAIAVVALLMILYQEFESRILVPRVYGRVLRLPPAIVIVALLVGGTLLGILGALLALPIAAGLQMIIRELHVELPGEPPADDATRAHEEQAEHVYEQLAEGAHAADAGAIATELVENTKPTESEPKP